MHMSRLSIGALGLAAALGLLVPGSAHAQDADASPVADGPRLPADSMEIGAKYVGWILDSRADSMWSKMTPESQSRMQSVGNLKETMGQIHMQIGMHERTISERYWMREGKPQFWHTAEFSEIAEPVVIRLVIEPDGMISGVGINPESQNPPVDDPNQHGDVTDG